MKNRENRECTVLESNPKNEENHGNAPFWNRIPKNEENRGGKRSWSNPGKISFSYALIFGAHCIG